MRKYVGVRACVTKQHWHYHRRVLKVAWTSPSVLKQAAEIIIFAWNTRFQKSPATVAEQWRGDGEGGEGKLCPGAEISVDRRRRRIESCKKRAFTIDLISRIRGAVKSPITPNCTGNRRITSHKRRYYDYYICILLHSFSDGSLKKNEGIRDVHRVALISAAKHRDKITSIYFMYCFEFTLLPRIHAVTRTHTRVTIFEWVTIRSDLGMSLILKRHFNRRH